MEGFPVVSKRLLFMAAAAIIVAGPTLPTNAADAGGWTLASATRRVLELAPEQRAVDADVAGRDAELRAAGSWPNPSINLRADDKLGQEENTGGSDLTRVGISQPLPFRRLARQRVAAEAVLAASEANRRAQQLQLEQATARAFTVLQFAAARLSLGLDRLKTAQEYAKNVRGKRDPLVRYLTPLERRRLAILQEEAQQAVLGAQREHERALIDFRRFLALAPDATVALPALTPAAAPLPLPTLQAKLDAHPVLVAAQQEVEAARAKIAVAESQRFADPEIGVFRERDFINDARRDVNVIELSFQIPLWNLNHGPVDAAKANAMRAQADLAVRQRDAGTRLQQNYTELTRLIAQAERMHENLLVPAREVLDLTRRAFASGEANVLTLVDANNTYFDAQTHYLEALKDSALAAANLRLAAGQSVLGAEVTP